MKTRPVLPVVLSLALLISTAPSSTAYSLASPYASEHSSLSELTVPTSSGSSSATPLSSPSSTPCLFSGWMTVLYENFDSVTSGLPANWASSWVTGTQGTWDTNAGTRYPSGGIAPSSPNVVFFNSYDAAPGHSARLYTATPLDLRRYSQVYLCFFSYQDPNYPLRDDRVQPQVSTNGGSVWTDVGDALHRYNAAEGWSSIGMDITSIAAGQPAVHVGFLGISEFGYDVHLDSIQVVAVPNLFLPLIKK